MKINFKVISKVLSYIDKLLKEKAPNNSPEIGYLDMEKGGLQRIRKKTGRSFFFFLFQHGTIPVFRVFN